MSIPKEDDSNQNEVDKKKILEALITAVSGTSYWTQEYLFDQNGRPLEFASPEEYVVTHPAIREFFNRYNDIISADLNWFLLEIAYLDKGLEFYTIVYFMKGMINIEDVDAKFYEDMIVENRIQKSFYSNSCLVDLDNMQNTAYIRKALKIFQAV